MVAELKPVLKIIDTQRHDVRRYLGDPYEFLRRMQSEHRTGMILIFVNQGSIQSMEFDTRVKESKGRE